MINNSSNPERIELIPVVNFKDQYFGNSSSDEDDDYVPLVPKRKVVDENHNRKIRKIRKDDDDFETKKVGSHFKL